ncbi:RagB/SusD family nutrient uptake outer membrane protein [Flagellimonas profundi]|uniref:RagB/SusD family nutrient uptake outer membrane protein n=1 Tax=Flagellimonas profundi TaxID=2915620 RepID=A0ABS3FEE5_9FLAO|nr:RagB/SusD family nutrient uptake outer membrane protein [Allomuricauda profundi]MBO0341514.1 RagB/SusD family nutrient uptake outer membrane protein [Allomuricauda profundi]
MKIVINYSNKPRRSIGSVTHPVIMASGFVLVLFGLLLSGCSEFVEVDPPRNTLVSETVFEDPLTLESALADLYYSMREQQGLVSGTFGLTPAMGIYSDELEYYGFNADFLQLYNHNVVAANDLIMAWWRQAYDLVYGANAIIAGVENSSDLSTMEKNRAMGQALFVRAYIHSVLVSLYGDVPYITKTDYLENNRISRMPEAEVYGKIIADLKEAIVLLDGFEPVAHERVVPDRYVALALLSRIYLYVENWEMAEEMATELISAFPLEFDLDRTFLKDSPETIWQLKPEVGNNTKEAAQLIILTVPGQNYALTDALFGAFEADDLRLEHWVASASDADETLTLYYAHKYKADGNETTSLEYSILFRSAEQHLIRAEARAHLENIVGAQTDLNSIRNRAGLSETSASTTNELLEAIMQERRVELFTEQGHRWFDLKRTERANAVMGSQKTNWKATDVLLPIPEAELDINPNLLPQNTGY